MKPSILITAILISLNCFWGCGSSNNPENLTVTVICYYHTDYSSDYAIEYHQGSIPFVKSGYIQTAFDISTDMTTHDRFDKFMMGGFDGINDNVIEQLYLTSSKEQAIDLAKKFTTYEAIKKWQDDTDVKYFELLKYRNAHHTYVTYIPDCNNCCTNTKIK